MCLIEKVIRINRAGIVFIEMIIVSTISCLKEKIVIQFKSAIYFIHNRAI